MTPVSCLILAIIFGRDLANAHNLLNQSSSLKATPTLQLGNLQARSCIIHPVGDTIVHTLHGDYCFSGAGVMDFSVEQVISIETGSHFASWYYIQSAKRNREPDNSDLRLHVCNDITVP